MRFHDMAAGDRADCVLHLIRHTFRLASRHDWDKISKALRPVYTAPTEAAARERFSEFADVWGTKYPGIIRLWESAWAEFVPFLAFEARGPPGHLLDQRDRVAQRKIPACRARSQALPERASRDQMSLPRVAVS